ncbi:MAG: hypothetical protein EU541_01215 [Promethearchaeota archaeon]|nr:MAG: hypothetical protein EU541_01215 [Candidatus Lokiarchaeota archaeon]
MNEKGFNIFFFIGHIAIDTVIKRGKEYKKSLGGSVCYCSLSLKEYVKNIDVSIISNFNKDSPQKTFLDQFKCNAIDLNPIKYIKSANTEFILDYFDHSRNLTLKSKAPDLKVKEIPNRYFDKSVDSVVFVPICNEISYDYVSKMHKIYPNAIFGIDVQGFIRKISPQGKVSLLHDKEKMDNLTKIINLLGEKLILKGSEEEMKIISNENDYEKVMNYFKQYSSISIMTLGEKGSIISKKGEFDIKVPAYKAKQVEDETGAGDVYLAIFLYEFLNSSKKWSDIKKAGYLASAAASFGVEKKGATGFQPKETVKKRFLKKW